MLNLLSVASIGRSILLNVMGISIGMQTGPKSDEVGCPSLCQLNTVNMIVQIPRKDKSYLSLAQESEPLCAGRHWRIAYLIDSRGFRRSLDEHQQTGEAVSAGSEVIVWSLYIYVRRWYRLHDAWLVLARIRRGYGESSFRPSPRRFALMWTPARQKTSESVWVFSKLSMTS